MSYQNFVCWNYDWGEDYDVETPQVIYSHNVKLAIQ